MRYILVNTFLVCVLSGMAGTALATPVGRVSGDMFYDKYWIYDRPAVPSDRHRGADMFARVPLMHNRNADLFDSANKQNTMGREDMFRTVRVSRIPVHTLRIDP